MSVTYSECVFLALVTHHACVILWSVVCPAPPRFFPHCFLKGTTFGGKNWT